VHSILFVEVPVDRRGEKARPAILYTGALSKALKELRHPKQRLPERSRILSKQAL